LSHPVSALVIANICAITLTTPQVAAATIDVRAGPGVGADAATEIRQVLQDADAFLAAQFSATPSASVRVHLLATTDAYVNALLRDGVGLNEEVVRSASQPAGHWMMVDGKGQIFVNLGNPNTSNRTAFYSDLSHEMVHVYQRALSAQPGYTVYWLDEGMAEVFAKRFLEHKGLLTYSQTLAEAVKLLKGRQQLPALNALTTSVQWMRSTQVYPRRVVYTTAFVAVDHLMQQRGKEALTAYYRLLRAQPDAEAAFRESFGLSSAAFAERFQTYLKELP
jgi:hypothetical protein